MRAAPPVSVRGTGGRPWRVVQTCLYALAAGVPAGWLALLAGFADSLALMLALAAMLLAAAIAWRLCAPAAYELRWDGQQWQAGGLAGALDVMIDLGPWLLLRLRADDGGERSLPLVAREAGPHLHALRAAIYAGAAPVTVITAPSAAR